MSLLVTGTIGLDTVETPHGRVEDVLGGTAVYFGLAASLLTPVRLVGAVGDDFPPGCRDVLTARSIDLTGLETRAGSKTFRWRGRYVGDMNAAETLRTDLNVIQEAPPVVPDAFLDSSFIFLANTHPAIQRGFLERLRARRLVVCDTMNLWIAEHRADLLKTLACVDGVVLNDGEARMLTGCTNLILAARAVLELGPEFVVVKKGEHGSILVTPGDVFALPAFPATEVKDPTGAGDSFAGGMMGYLAAADRTDVRALRSAVAWGTAAASITIEDFSVGALRGADRAEMERRVARLRKLVAFE